MIGLEAKKNKFGFLILVIKINKIKHQETITRLLSSENVFKQV